MISPIHFSEGRQVKFLAENGVVFEICTADLNLPFPEIVAATIADALNAKSKQENFHDEI
ncbi:hypothetical protein GLP59_10420 [Sulfitobacter sp. M220]|uniref:hypothetical protein n=1 Tax=Sulfitobacter sp. M220 TaxID=2675333 RepID=UPI001F43F56B|nr:hypothetical protein [Sulfitobacter sp. M220]MCF7778054.1 hypothetical protein [Sulfitobacter sp. M220]